MRVHHYGKILEGGLNDSVAAYCLQLSNQISDLGMQEHPPSSPTSSRKTLLWDLCFHSKHSDTMSMSFRQITKDMNSKICAFWINEDPRQNKGVRTDYESSLKKSNANRTLKNCTELFILHLK